VARRLLRLEGWQIVVLSGSPRFATAMLRRPDVSHRLWNGPLEARMLRYKL
jgi:23S rRNA G2445 N2-methylase RlmL